MNGETLYLSLSKVCIKQRFSLYKLIVEIRNVENYKFFPAIFHN